MNNEERELDLTHINILKKIKTGDIFSNFRSLCEVINIPYGSGGNQRKAMVDEIERHLSFKKLGKGYKIQITEVYDVAMPKTIENTYFDNFLPIFEAFLKEKFEESMSNSCDYPYKLIYTTKGIIQGTHLYNTLYSYLLMDSTNKIKYNNYTTSQLELVYKILDYDYDTVYSSIVYNSLKKLINNHHAEVTRVWINKEQQILQGESLIKWEGIYSDARSVYLEPKLSLVKANDKRNEELCIEDFVYPAWRIIMGKTCFEYFKQTLNKRKSYHACQTILQDKRINKINNSFQEVMNKREDKGIIESFGDLLRKFTSIIGIDENDNLIYKVFDTQEELDVYNEQRREEEVKISEVVMQKSKFLF